MGIQANEKLREIEEQIARGVYIPDKRIPTFENAAADWLELKKTQRTAFILGNV
jgi:hypothetical protein